MVWNVWQVPTNISKEEKEKWEKLPVRKFWTTLSIIIGVVSLCMIAVGYFII